MKRSIVMNNFIYENKTKVYFGKGGVKEYLSCVLKHYGSNVMLAYGGGSVKKNGVYDEVMGILKAAGKTVTEFSGIMPNPTYAKVQEGAKLVRENSVDFILAVGGGSVIDCCKIVSAQAKNGGGHLGIGDCEKSFPHKFCLHGSNCYRFGNRLGNERGSGHHKREPKDKVRTFRRTGGLRFPRPDLHNESPL